MDVCWKPFQSKQRVLLSSGRTAKTCRSLLVNFTDPKQWSIPGPCTAMYVLPLSLARFWSIPQPHKLIYLVVGILNCGGPAYSFFRAWSFRCPISSFASSCRSLSCLCSISWICHPPDRRVETVGLVRPASRTRPRGSGRLHRSDRRPAPSLWVLLSCSPLRCFSLRGRLRIHLMHHTETADVQLWEGQITATRDLSMADSTRSKILNTAEEQSSCFLALVPTDRRKKWSEGAKSRLPGADEKDEWSKIERKRLIENNKITRADWTIPWNWWPSAKSAAIAATGEKPAGLPECSRATCLLCWCTVALVGLSRSKSYNETELLCDRLNVWTGGRLRVDDKWARFKSVENISIIDRWMLGVHDSPAWTYMCYVRVPVFNVETSAICLREIWRHGEAWFFPFPVQ